ncbi:hypothetical protein FLA105534_01321 [Flavobacterium bizetiae]|uniref:Plasmid stabilization system protein n=1 Tax=Flavobacterium bizetiae TaxID=2704140 RepID=A0A6J4GC43_9FLAO|nr:type II toxin-antitoxin system RelE/ParE family toxin [Flavobacterium bizetiae]CAA9196796.1 hypothetical protein FLA105534_01321 [Flavobacterium bizetiae]CAD5342444.1 hypothetical protein FLA105535_02431 [Flavobacterium bizetiae]CAD5348360.1 hypothetical protein FLA105534_02323 [Flavobacterium bizetiae]
MNYKVIVSPIALKNIEEAVEYYIFKTTKKVALDFLNDYKSIYKALQVNPFYQLHDNNYRFLPFKKFPYIAFLLLMNYQKLFF